ncbi:MBL fold metallo-hydrolase [Desulfobulbus alkaliphilus]|uniref:MBL fold metallo-hydrolase n=1 Tax=Desulfobulbus alkaliphilus TaxID=869814 RepID=UPI001962C0D1|nr:MBL fold metallo-hydrolase [Desulfobulbus alkaliphilus]
MRFSVLGSGSRGNCTLVQSRDSCLLIDNGFSGKELVERLARLGVAPDMLSALVVTHEHSDHVKGVGVLARRCNLTVYANEATHRAMAATVGALPSPREFAVGEPFFVEGLCLHPFSVSHDAVDPVGFTVSDSEHTLGYCTDTGKITRLIEHRLQACQALILEANHDVQMLKSGPYPFPLKQRVLSGGGHLANSDSLAFARRLAGGCLKRLVLAHLSAANNHPDLLTVEVRRVLGQYEDLHVSIAAQEQAGPLLDIVSLDQ